MLNTKNILSRLSLLIFVPERCGTHDLNFNKDSMLHKNTDVKKHDVNLNILLKHNRGNDLSSMDNIYE